MAMMRALGAGEPVTRVAKRYGVTRQWIHRLRARHGEQGEPGLLPRSRRPRSVHNRTSGEVRALIAQVRERLLAGAGTAGRAASTACSRSGWAEPRPSPRSTASSRTWVWSRPSPGNGRAARTSGSRPSCPTRRGSRTSRTGRWPTARTRRSSPGSTTIRAWCSCRAPRAR
ncbi:helix-turn-helix domain-containing protein [Bifidobacterium pseudolongum]|uniref:helix-turn-helix domain-containing protein n=1 Tax=Bifidobacterium pseudolongum TaxID=1694 RepID=UPI0034A47471